jgi:hypothetical protein
MELSSRSLVRAVSAAWIVVGAAEARAACNVIPDPTTQLLSAPVTTGPAQALKVAVEQENARFGGKVPYKGAVGRIDRVFLSPEGKRSLLIAADGRCAPDGTAAAFDVAEKSDLVAALIVTPASGAPTVAVATGGRAACPALTGDSGDVLNTACEDAAITAVPDQKNVLAVSLPRVAIAPDARGVKLALFRATSPAQLEASVQRLAALDCAALCGAGASSEGIGACIDQIYAPTELSTAQLVVYGAPDMVRCKLGVGAPTPIPWNTFAAQCRNGDGWAAPMPGCTTNTTNPPTTITMWEDDCHGIYVPMKYGALLGPLPNNKWEWERQVQGQAALTQKGGASDDNLWVPGAEFVGTLAETDLTGVGPFSSDPRRAQLDVWFPSEFELGIRGVSDKPESILHVVPRLGATLLCADGPDEACTSVPTVPSLDATRCACRDRYAPDCKCDPAGVAKYFQCSNSDMPCTRHAHCYPGGLCNKQPTCQKEGDVWKKGGPNTAGPTKCWHDGHCTQANKTQCGFLLFNVGPVREANKKEIVLDSKLTGAGARKRRGACRDTGTPSKPRKKCDNSGGNPACAAGEGDCAEYLLEALGGTKLTP